MEEYIDIIINILIELEGNMGFLGAYATIGGSVLVAIIFGLKYYRSKRNKTKLDFDIKNKKR